MKTFRDLAMASSRRRRRLMLATAVLAGLVVAAPAAALRAQVGDPLNPFNFSGYFYIAPRELWIGEVDRNDGLVEENRLSIDPRADGTGARLSDAARLVPGLPLLLDNCGRLPFTSEFELICSGSISQALVELGPGSDVLRYGLTAPGRLSGGPGNDVVNGGPGRDALGDGVHSNGDDGNDVLRGGSGNDVLADGSGVDLLEGGSGNDELTGGRRSEYTDDPYNEDSGTGLDQLHGDDGNDVLIAISGDILRGGTGADTLIEVQNLPTDTIAYDVSAVSGAGADTMLGETGNDILGGGFGSDVLDGGDGADKLDGGPGGDTIAGGPGIDTVDYSTRIVPVLVTFDGLANDGESNEADLLRSDLENVLGGFGNDVLVGNGLANRLIGGGGGDSLAGGVGSDWLSGEAENDVIDGGAGTDNLVGGAGNDTLRGGADADVLAGGSGIDSLNGGLGGDVLNGGDGNDLIEARDGVADKVSCGVGYDEARVDPVDYVAPDCERVISSK